MNTTKNLSQDKLCQGHESNRAPSEHKSGALLLDQPIRSVLPPYSIFNNIAVTVLCACLP
jgi:hypothetical protein